GTNDWWSGLPVGTIDDYTKNTGTGTTSGAYRKIINKIRSLNASAKIVLITPMQRNDFVYIGDSHNNAYGSYKPKNGRSLEDFVNAVAAIGKYEKIPVVDLYHNKELSIENLVKFKRLKDPATGAYKNYKYPTSATIPFNPSTDEYPYPAAAMNMTHDGLHPSDKGNAMIAKSIVKIFKTLGF
ncbi:MAG: SGNH/GDSL hydrolase family protein, partial [Sphingobacteriales bacterium]